MNIFDAPQEVIDKYLEEMGETEAEARKRIFDLQALVEANPGELKGCDPSQEKKFTMPVGFEILD